jgi:hypothetical protein
MNKPREGTCRSCGDPIFWMGTAKGSWIPVNPEEDGSAPEGDLFDPQTMTSHFATCADANDWRKKK